MADHVRTIARGYIYLYTPTGARQARGNLHPKTPKATKATTARKRRDSCHRIDTETGQITKAKVLARSYRVDLRFIPSRQDSPTSVV
ncbi:hypothetical protein E4U41_002355 [Claviceps citrina]|nr:hypothetical protein E4U41_002355 [Claviceps citrina]